MAGKWKRSRKCREIEGERIRNKKGRKRVEEECGEMRKRKTREREKIRGKNGGRQREERGNEGDARHAAMVRR